MALMNLVNPAERFDWNSHTAFLTVRLKYATRSLDFLSTKHTTNCYLAIIEEPLESCDWYQSYERKTGSPFAKSIHVWLWWIFNKTHTVFYIYMQKTILKLFVTHTLRNLLFMKFFRNSLKAFFLIMLHYLNIFFYWAITLYSFQGTF